MVKSRNEPSLSQDNIIEEGIKVVKSKTATIALQAQTIKDNEETVSPARLTKNKPVTTLTTEQPENENIYPDHITQRFLQTDNKFHFPDKSLAFIDHGKKLVTKHENKELVRSLITIAEARGWEQITVKGSKEFRQTAWLEASLLGIEVKGYKPTKVEVAHLESQLTKKGSIENSIEQGIARKSSQDTSITSPNSSKLNTPIQEKTIPIRSGHFSGVLMEHGEDHYQFDKNNKNSYFVKIKTEEGEQTIWGVNLASSIAKAGVKLGERVIINKENHEPVTVTKTEKDKQGKEVVTSIPAKRNNWTVISAAKPEAFMHEERDKVIEKYPELAPAYVTIAAAKKFAEQQGFSKENVERFLTIAKENLAEKMAHGEKIPSPNIRNKKEATQQQTPVEKQYDYERMR